jgi:hypothetical protein
MLNKHEFCNLRQKTLSKDADRPIHRPYTLHSCRMLLRKLLETQTEVA